MTALCGHIPVIAILLTHGGEVNQANKDGASPLHLAAFYGHEEITTMFLEKGADAHLAGNNGQKPIDVAKTQKIKDILIAHVTKKQQQQEEREQQPDQAASSKVMDEAQWFQAAKDGNLALIQQGINDKIDVNCRDNNSRTAIWWATQRDHLHILEYLISQHADTSIANVSANGM